MEDCSPLKDHISTAFFVSYALRIQNKSNDSSRGQIAKASWSIQKRKFPEHVIDFYCEGRHEFTMKIPNSTLDKHDVSMGQRCVLAQISVDVTWAFYFYDDPTAATFYNNLRQVTENTFGQTKNGTSTNKLVDSPSANEKADTDLKSVPVDESFQRKKDGSSLAATHDDLSTLFNACNDHSIPPVQSEEKRIVEHQEVPATKLMFSAKQATWLVRLKGKRGGYGQYAFPMEDVKNSGSKSSVSFDLSIILTIDLQGNSIVLYLNPHASDQTIDGSLRESLIDKPSIVEKYGIDPEIVTVKVMMAYSSEYKAHQIFQKLLGIWNDDQGTEIVEVEASCFGGNTTQVENESSTVRPPREIFVTEMNNKVDGQENCPPTVDKVSSLVPNSVTKRKPDHDSNNRGFNSKRRKALGEVFDNHF